MAKNVAQAFFRVNMFALLPVSYLEYFKDRRIFWNNIFWTPFFLVQIFSYQCLTKLALITLLCDLKGKSNFPDTLSCLTIILFATANCFGHFLLLQRKQENKSKQGQRK